MPDETALVPQWRYVNPRAAEWPAAEFIVGNPPFIGNKRMRDALGDGYVEALRSTSQRVPDTADFVMYWWDQAAERTRAGQLRRFGLITTNSLRQTFNRGVIDYHLSASTPLHLRVAVPDHPWVDSASNADVRIAMTVATAEDSPSELWTVVGEREGEHGEIEVSLTTAVGEVHADLTVGASVGKSTRLAANTNLCFQGMNLVGKGFRVTPSEVALFGYDLDRLPDVLMPHCNARDLLQGGEHSLIIDLFGYTEDGARQEHPALYQYLLDRVKPERDLNNRRSYRERWWMFGEPRGKLRASWKGLNRLLVTAETAKHRIFAFQSKPFCPDHKLYAICLDDGFAHGVLSCNVHLAWSLRAGGRLGVGNDPTWTNTTTFLPFPFPHDDTGLTPELRTRISTLAEQLDAHRKAQQAAHPDLTLTGMYNVLEKLRKAEPLNAKDKLIHTQGLVSVLKSLHDDLDAAVLAAYCWGDLQAALADHTQTEARAAAVETLLERLVALNAKRAAEEATGLVRWLRPEFQNPQAQAQAQAGAAAGAQAGIEMDDDETVHQPTAAPAAAAVAKRAWPAGLPEQIKAVADTLAASQSALSLPDIEARFNARGRWRARLPTILETLEALGRARRLPAAAAAANDGLRWLAA